MPMNLKRKITKIIIHCSDTPEGRDDSIEDIRRWHKARNFKDVGYHYVIRLDGTLEKGRMIEDVGAHCTGHNAESIGICYIGGKTADMKTAKDTRTDAQKATMSAIIALLRSQLGNLPVHGHRYYDPYKQCPCFDAEAEYNN